MLNTQILIENNLLLKNICNFESLDCLDTKNYYGKKVLTVCP